MQQVKLKAHRQDKRAREGKRFGKRVLYDICRLIHPGKRPAPQKAKDGGTASGMAAENIEKLVFFLFVWSGDGLNIY
jgi:hypothetical protein